jgi:cytochrome b561
MAGVLGTTIVRNRYSSVAIALHWTIAALIIFNLVTGLLHDDLSKATNAWLMPLHFSSGLTVLVLSVVRVGWRLAHPAPPHLPGIRRHEKILAAITYALFYILMLAMPLTGWMLISAHPANPAKPPFLLWGVVPWPMIGFLQTMAAPGQKQAHETLGNLHQWGGYTMIGLLALHIAGAMKHQFLDRVPEVQRMVPGGSTRTI